MVFAQIALLDIDQILQELIVFPALFVQSATEEICLEIVYLTKLLLIVDPMKSKLPMELIASIVDQMRDLTLQPKSFVSAPLFANQDKHSILEVFVNGPFHVV